MGKSTNFIGQPILGQIIKFISRSTINKISREYNADRYIKKFDGYTHLATMLYAVMKDFTSLREVCINLLSDSNKLQHLGISYCVNKSTLADANKRRSSKFFEAVYMSLYRQYAKTLSDSCVKKEQLSKLYIIDSTTISLFKQILKGVGRNPKYGKKKGGIKAHVLIRADEDVPCLVKYTAAAKHDHVLLKYLELPKGSFLTFDKGYVDYAAYEKFSLNSIYYVTKLKSNAKYESDIEIDIPENADSSIIRDEIIHLNYGQNKKETHKTRRIAQWDDDKKKVFVYVTNNFELEAESIVNIYRKRWQIELLFKRLKQNFPLKYFLGDNVNAIEIQIWTAMIANLIMTVIKSKLQKTKIAYSTIISLIKSQLMYYVNLFKLLNNPTKAWKEKIKLRNKDNQLPLFET
jgi:hypothetical protein